jgi:hypothetical protein
MAVREKWPYEEVKGVGGTRRMYEVPDALLAQKPPRERAEPTMAPTATAGTSHAVPQIARVVGTIAAGSSKVDTEKLALAIRALDEFEAERGIKVSAERRPVVIAILYDYLQSAPEMQEGEKAMAMVLKALG